MFKLKMYVPCITNTQPGHGWQELYNGTTNMPLAGYRPPSPMGDFEDYDFLKLHYITHKMKYFNNVNV